MIIMEKLSLLIAYIYGDCEANNVVENFAASDYYVEFRT